VTKRLSFVGALLVVVATACSSPTPPGANFGEGQRFIVAVVDSQDDVGQGASVTTAEDGTPFISYFGFPDELDEGEVAAPRPVGTPFLPAVLLTSVASDGVFTRGAVAQLDAEFQPNGIEPAFRPAKIPDLDLTKENANGSDIAVAADGTVHVVWTSGNGVFHAVAAPGADSVVSTVFELDLTVSQAGPVGRPSVALDAAGAPVIAFGETDGADVIVHLATQDGDAWALQDVATVECSGCPPPLPTAIVGPGDAPVVAYGNPVDGVVYAATPDGDDWVTEAIDDGGIGAGLAGTTDGDAAYLTFFGETGVVLATWDGSTWSTEEAAQSTTPDEVSGLDAPTTGVAAAGGDLFVTWQDDEGVHLIERPDGGTFGDVAVAPSAAAGTTPAVAVTSEGTVTLVWYAPVTHDLFMGVWGTPEEVLIANPSPVPTVSMPAPVIECGGKQADLEITGNATNVFDKNCLVAPADEEFSVTFINEGGTHNFQILPEEGAASDLLITTTPDSTGPATSETDPETLEAGSYWFQCGFHPTTMFGQLAAVKGAK
jgi:plastocyanin